MNVFQTMVSRFQTKQVDFDHMPVVNDFVDVLVGGKTSTVCCEDISKNGFETQCPAKAAVGATALFNYGNRVGRFRFHTQCTKIDGKQATFALPVEITVIEKFAEKRGNFRLKMLMNVQWRYAPDGVGYGPFVRSTTTNISVLGARLCVDRELRKGTLVEILFDQVLVDGRPLAALGQLMRSTQKDGNGLFAGVRFTSLGLTTQNAVSEFIQKRQRNDKKHYLAR